MKRVGIWWSGLSATLLLIGFAFTTIGCGSSSTQIRFVHAADGAGNVDVLIDTKSVSTNLPYSNSTSYIKASSGTRTIEVRPTGTTADLVKVTPTLAGGSSSTAIVVNTPSITLSIFTDDNSNPPSGDAKLRIINAAQNAGPMDPYLISPGSGISGVSPSAPTIAFNSSTQKYLTPAAGSYEIVLTQAGTQNIIVDTGSSSPLSLGAGQVRTLVAIDNLGNTPFVFLSDFK